MNLDTSKKYTILYAEDEDEIREGYAAFLKPSFKSVYLASDGIQAFDLYHKFTPDILLLDISMPKIDGLTLVEMLRKEGSKSHIIILTAHMDQDKLLKAIPLGLSSYLIKPVKKRELQSSLIKVLETLERENYVHDIIELNHDSIWNSATKTLSSSNIKTELTKNETSLIEILILNKNRHLPVTDIVKAFQNYYEEYDMTEEGVRNTLKRLRKKVPQELIINTHGLGYKISL